MEKAKIILTDYDIETKTITMDIVDNGKHINDCKKEGITVDEFKKLARSKYGDDLIIVNKIKRNRELMGEHRESFDGTVKDERYNMRDIMEAMRNDSMTNKGLPKV